MNTWAWPGLSALLLGVHLGRVGAVAGVLDEDPFLDRLLEHERYVVVDLVGAAAAGGLAGKRVALEHGDVYVVEHRRGDGGEVRLADVAAHRLDLPPLALLRRLGDLLSQGAPFEEALAVFLERVRGLSLHLVAPDLVHELAQRLLGLCVGTVEAARFGLVLSRSRIEPHGNAELPLAAPALRLALVALDDVAAAFHVCHATHHLLRERRPGGSAIQGRGRARAVRARRSAEGPGLRWGEHDDGKLVASGIRGKAGHDSNSMFCLGHLPITSNPGRCPHHLGIREIANSHRASPCPCEKGS